MPHSDRPLILVTGAARSGTSLTMQVLEACGARVGRVNTLYEHGAVRERALKPFLASIGADPLGQKPLPPESYTQPADWAERVKRRLNGANCYKDAKMALLWRLWADAFPHARWVLCWRDIDDIAASCLRTAFMRAYKTHEEWAWWAGQYHGRMEALRASGADCIDVWPHIAVRRDVGAYRDMIEHCGLTWNKEAVKAAIQPNAWHA